MGRGGVGPPWTLPDFVWGPLAVGSLMGAVGLIAMAAGQPWLVPSLGPTAFLQAEKPDEPSARFYNTVVGHFVGIAAGVAAVWILGASASPSALADKVLAPARVGAAALAGVVTMIGLAGLKAPHPPAAATMLLFALGAVEANARGAGYVAAGVLIIATLGEGVRYLRREVLTPPPG